MSASKIKEDMNTKKGRKRLAIYILEDAEINIIDLYIFVQIKWIYGETN